MTVQITTPGQALTAAALRAGAMPGQSLVYSNDTGLYSWKSPGVVPDRDFHAIWAYQNGWVAYDDGISFQRPKYYIDGKGKVRILGLLSGGGYGSPVVPMFTLPVGYRPDKIEIFNCGSGTNGGHAMVQVKPNGEVGIINMYYSGSNAYLDLSKIRFFPAGAVTWTTPTFANSWLNYDATNYAPLRYFIDSDGIVHWSGVVRSGTLNVAMTTAIPSGAMPPSGSRLFCQPADSGAARVEANVAVGTIYVQFYETGGNNALVSVCGIEYPGANHTLNYRKPWATAQPQYANSWLTYDGATYPGFEYWKDSVGIVGFSGLIKAGTSAAQIVPFMPPGFRPGGTTISAVMANNSQSRLDVGSNGMLSISGYGTGGNNTWVSLDDIRYPAEG